METVDLGRLARRVTVVPIASAETTPVVVYERKRKRRKGSPMFRRLEKRVRRVSEARQVFATTYLDRHNASNEKKKDGWLRDRRYNRVRARRKAMKVLRRR